MIGIDEEFLDIRLVRALSLNRWPSWCNDLSCVLKSAANPRLSNEVIGAFRRAQYLPLSQVILRSDFIWCDTSAHLHLLCCLLCSASNHVFLGQSRETTLSPL